MANGGWYGTNEEWSRAEAPLKLLDEGFYRFAEAYDLALTKNFKDWPGRSVRWQANDVSCLVQLYLEGIESLGVNLWICASQDRGNKRFWRQEFVFKDVQAESKVDSLPALLHFARSKLETWSAQPEQLELVTEVTQL